MSNCEVQRLHFYFCVAYTSDLFVGPPVKRLSRGLVRYTCTHCGPISLRVGIDDRWTWAETTP